MSCFSIFLDLYLLQELCSLREGCEVQLSYGVHHLYLTIRGVDGLVNSIRHLISET